MTAVARYTLFTFALVASGGVSVVWLVLLMAMGANASPSQELLLKRLMLSVLAVGGLSLAAAVLCVVKDAWTPALLIATLPVAFCVLMFVVMLITGT